MNLQKVGIVFWKEALDTLRDGRSLFLIFVVPLVLYPVMFGMMGFVIKGEKTKEEGAVVTVAIRTDGEEASGRVPRLAEHLSRTKGIELRRELVDSLEVTRGEADAIVLVPESLEIVNDSLGDGSVDTTSLAVLFDSTKPRSKTARNRVLEALDDYRVQELKRSLSRAGIDMRIIDRGKVMAKDVASARRVGASLLGDLIPYLLVVLISAGAMHTAIDATAGEKERSTLETILASSASRRELVFGKYLATFVVSSATALMGMIGLGATIASRLSILTMDESSSIVFPPEAFGILFATIIPIAALVSGLLLMIGCFSKSLREGQTYASYLQMVLIVLALMAIFKSTDVSARTYLIPIVNVTLLQKEMLLGTLDPMHVLLSIASTLVLAVATLVISVRLFENEKILFRTK